MAALLERFGAVVTLVFLGLTFMVPNLVAIAGFAVMPIGIEMRVHLVEESYLRRVHGAAYIAYASRAGRFVSGIGRLRPETRG